MAECNHYSQLMLQSQARIHTGFHRFTEIGSDFHDQCIFNNKKHFLSLNLANIRSEWTEWLGNQGKGTLRSENQKKFMEESAPEPP